MEKVIRGEPVDLTDAVNAQAFYDIAFLAHRLRSHASMSTIPNAQGFGCRTIGDVTEMALSAGCTASLCSYGRVGTWEYVAAKRKSKWGGELIRVLDDLREAFSDRQHTLEELSATPKMSRPTRAFALLGLTLGAVDVDLIDTYIDHADLPLSRDPQRAAGLACEEYFETLDIEQAAVPILAPGRRLTANPDRAGARIV